MRMLSQQVAFLRTKVSYKNASSLLGSVVQYLDSTGIEAHFLIH